MKDMFLAEKLGYDPYEPFPADEKVLTEDDFKVSAMNIKFIISFRHDIADKWFFKKYHTKFKGNIISQSHQVRGINFTDDNTIILPFPDYSMNISRAVYEDYQEVLFYVNRRIEINKTKTSAR